MTVHTDYRPQHRGKPVSHGNRRRAPYLELRGAAGMLLWQS
jgi:hypothetical protein